jgi:aryl-alcohol dehydrogenase-like predicted oxidoreductase
MNQIELGTTGVKVSRISLGTMLMGSATDPQTSIAMLDRYLDLGGNFLDTANCYAWWIGKGEFVGDESELLLGNWMRQRKNRRHIFLATKVGARLKEGTPIRDASGNPRYELVAENRELLSPNSIRSGIENSLRRLQTDYIDLYYAHIDDRHTPLEEILGTFNDLIKEGKVRFIGCSNFRTWRLERANRIAAANGWQPFVAWQQEFTYVRPKSGADFGETVHVDDEQLDYLASNPQVSLVAYSPLLRGIYESETKRKAYYNWHLYDSPDSTKRLEVVSSMSKEMGISNSQLVLAWMLQHRSRAIPIVAASSLPQFEHNFAVADIQLTAQQMQILDDAKA